jgi:hypothetical protein
MQFSSGLTGVLDSIVAPLSASVSDVTFLLRSDAMGFAGAVMDTFTFHAVTATLQLLTASSTNHPTLNAGTLYWLEAVAPASFGNDSINWYYTSPPVMGTVEVENPIPAVLTGQQISAFAVLGADTPEPSTLWTVALSLALLCTTTSENLRSIRRFGGADPLVGPVWLRPCCTVLQHLSFFSARKDFHAAAMSCWTVQRCADRIALRIKRPGSVTR